MTIKIITCGGTIDHIGTMMIFNETFTLNNGKFSFENSITEGDKNQFICTTKQLN